MEGKYSEEKALLERYNKELTDSKDNCRVNHAFNQFLDAVPEDVSDVDSELMGNRIWSRLPPSVIKKPIRKIWISYAAGLAAAVALVVYGVWFFNSPQKVNTPGLEQATADDVQPGKIGATLTLANGKKIYINDVSSGKLAESSGVTISKTADGQLRYEVTANQKGRAEFNTLKTANGEHIEVVLPDQSTVFLNAASSIRYLSNFSHMQNRNVELSGEAYFDVSKDKLKPFIVNTGRQEVRVLGTHFNINAYADDGVIRTILLEGSVRLNNDRLLSPGQMALNRGGVIDVQNVNVEQETAWIHNDFNFRAERLEMVMLKMARWYGVSVNYSAEDLKDIPLTAHLSRTKSLATVLNSIGATANLNFVISGKAVKVSHK